MPHFSRVCVLRAALPGPRARPIHTGPRAADQTGRAKGNAYRSATPSGTPLVHASFKGRPQRLPNATCTTPWGRPRPSRRVCATHNYIYVFAFSLCGFGGPVLLRRT